jgi:hypothetical protein
VTWLKTPFLCCYRKEAAEQDADAEDSETQSAISDSSPEKKQKKNPKVNINKYIYKEYILGVRRCGSLRVIHRLDRHSEASQSNLCSDVFSKCI